MMEHDLSGNPRAAKMAVIASLLQDARRVIESTVVGGSMSPSLPDGARVRIECGNEMDLKPGTVVAFMSGETPIIGHRIVAMGRRIRTHNLIVTRGDNSILCDLPIGRNRILGVIVDWYSGNQWRPIPAPRNAGIFHRIMAAIFKSLVIVTLEMNVELSRWISHTLFRASWAVQRIRSRRLAR